MIYAFAQAPCFWDGRDCGFACAWAPLICCFIRWDFYGEGQESRFINIVRGATSKGKEINIFFCQDACWARYLRCFYFFKGDNGGKYLQAYKKRFSALEKGAEALEKGADRWYNKDVICFWR